ncbi:DUF4238 domain-containing protein [Streptomyces hilarionis]|uniref:DUF4238 domain-containing protein n=1 Tax=Streptomyces hilarionis TaxID=2839954 RepID=UPI00211A5936|nr:DUF4238 domain-containing protein [Streptomyces hilarionis]MCQ9135920.1 DUF4238 domain-containing protein [Streptomyces hilarionis]
MSARKVSRQHVVSQVLLKRFTMPETKGGGSRLIPFDLNYPDRHHKLKGSRECGWIKDFVAYESGSIEELWGQVERRVPEAFRAVDAGTPFNKPDHVEILRDLVVLHLVRSHRYREAHQTAVVTVRDRLRRGLTQVYTEELRREALRETGLRLADPQALNAFAEKLIESSEPAQDQASGKAFRVSIEEMYRKVRDKVSGWQVEVLSPQVGQFLIGDTPAITLRKENGELQYGMAVGDATTIVLPLGPGHLLALGPQNRSFRIPKDLVDELNAVQILAANRYVYLHPQSGLESFVKAGVSSRMGR